MGILSDIFVSTPADAAKYDELMESERIDSRFEVASYKNLTTLEFGTLWAILTGQTFDMDKHNLDPLADEEESWLHRFPEPYVKLLAGLTSVQIKTASVAWAATEELEADPADMEEIIVDIAKLARHAMLPGKGLYLWNCL
jgi:hypothetical protein